MKKSILKFSKGMSVLFVLLVSSCTVSPLNSEDPFLSSDSNSEVTTSATPSKSEDHSSSGSSLGSEKPFDPSLYLDENFESSYGYYSESYDIAETVPPNNPYANIVTAADKARFYGDTYNRASSYEDAMFRTAQGLVSGDIRDTPRNASYPLNHLPNRQYKKLSTYRTHETNYEYDEDDNFKAYTINNLDGKVKKIYYGAAYVSLEDVAAYLFAFAEVPANYEASRNATKKAINKWGEYGRVNNNSYSSNVNEYKYEPMMPYTDNGGVTSYDDMYYYYEMDFGYTLTPWGFGEIATNPYNNGVSINRGTVRFVYTAINQANNGVGAKYIPLAHRHVFLTFNHYNDFIEYLNYENGWGVPFGWMSAGNAYIGGMETNKYGPSYDDFVDPYPQTQHVFPQVASLSELRSLLNN